MKDLFKILDQIEQDDIKNETKKVLINPNYLSGNKIKNGSVLLIASDEKSLERIESGELLPILVLIDAKELLKRSKEETK